MSPACSGYLSPVDQQQHGRQHSLRAQANGASRRMPTIASATLGVPPDRCVVVEDSPAGITAARAAGIATIGFVGAHPGLDEDAAAELLEQAGAGVVISRLDGIPAALQFLTPPLG